MSLHSSSRDSDASLDPTHAIEDLLDELARAAASAASSAEFHRLLLDRLTPALGVRGAASWTRGSADGLRLEYQINLAAARSAAARQGPEAHRLLVDEALRTGEPRIAPPAPPDASESASENPTDCWLIVYPYAVDGESLGVIELVERGELAPAEGRRHLQVLSAVGEILTDFHRGRELRALRERMQTAQRLDAFAERVHRSLDVKQTAYAIANEGRRLLGCDRFSVLTRHGGSARALAISGVDTLDRRAQVVRRLEKLAASAIACGEAVWYCDDAGDLPGEIERPLQDYLDESHARVLSVVPLEEPGSDKKRWIGAIVAEQYQSSESSGDLRDRLTIASAHCSSALNNAITHSRMPLAAVSRLLARLRVLTLGARLPRTVAVIAAVAAVTTALTLIPADFDIEAHGELQPLSRRDVFATSDGQVSELLVEQGQSVEAGQPLIVLRRPELDLEFRRVAGEERTVEKKLAAVQAERLENLPASPSETRRESRVTASDEEELKEQLKGLKQQREILEREQSELVVRSPIAGEALTWNLKRQLEARPVQRGQSMLTVADLSGDWGLELHVADRKTGHVLAARDASSAPLDVAFTLAAEPSTVYHGEISELALATDLDEANDPTLLAKVRFDRAAVAGLRPGATVIARIHCGRRAIGYVWLHELFQYVQSRWWW